MAMNASSCIWTGRREECGTYSILQSSRYRSRKLRYTFPNHYSSCSKKIRRTPMYLKRLLDSHKDWDVAVIYIPGRPPIGLYKECTVMDSGADTTTINMKGSTLLPWADPREEKPVLYS